MTAQFQSRFWIDLEDVVFNRILEHMRLRTYNRLVELFSVMPPMQIGEMTAIIARRARP